MKFIHFFYLALMFVIIGCEKEEDSGSGEYVPDVEVGSIIEFTPTEGGSVDWFKYEYNSNGVEACNSEDRFFTIASWEYERIEDDLGYVKTTFPSGNYEEFWIDGLGEYRYEGHYASGVLVEGHKGNYNFSNIPCD